MFYMTEDFCINLLKVTFVKITGNDEGGFFIDFHPDASKNAKSLKFATQQECRDEYELITDMMQIFNKSLLGENDD